MPIGKRNILSSIHQVKHKLKMFVKVYLYILNRYLLLRCYSNATFYDIINNEGLI